MIFFYSKKVGSGIIRGMQVADYIGAGKNPVNGHENNVCIYVKTQPPENFPKQSYIDVLDGYGLVSWVKRHPKIGVIAASKVAQEYLSEELKRTDIKLVQQHHCNYEQGQRPEREITTVGYIGSKNGLKELQPIKLKTALTGKGLKFKAKTKFIGRGDVIAFYKSIDIQVAFRPEYYLSSLKTPLKLCNAGSFGIPTVAYPEKSYVREFSGCFVPVKSTQEIVENCSRLKDNVYYNTMASKALAQSERYHIDHIAEQYKVLE